MKQLIRIAILFTGLYSVSCNAQSKQDEWRSLFNGKDLAGWDTYLAPIYNEKTESFDGSPIGLNNDPNGVFTVVKHDGVNALRISGENHGGVSTVDSFKNYHLRLKFKWGEAKHKPRDKRRRDSGILYHAHGEQGAFYGIWMQSQEFQIQEDDTGDYWSVYSEADIRARRELDGTYIYDPEQEPMHFGENSERVHRVKKYPYGAEKPNDQWNTLDLYSVGPTSLHVVNGTLVMRLENSYEIIDGKKIPLTAGKIQLQSEGAEIFYRDMKIRSIEALPEFVD